MILYPMKKRIETDRYDHIIFFDGVCNLCNGAVRFVIKYDSDQIFSFAPLQSDLAREMLGKEYVTDTLIYCEAGKVYKKSTGALKIARRLKHFKYLYYFIYLPAFLRDFIYDVIARNRYKIFGKRDSCIIDKNLKNRFIAEYKEL
jgi:predicted DCC family thiol-disulfide oxidoreductase YuxK